MTNKDAVGDTRAEAGGAGGGDIGGDRGGKTETCRAVEAGGEGESTGSQVRLKE